MSYNLINSISYVFTMSFINFVIKLFIYYYDIDDIMFILIIFSSFAPLSLIYDILYNRNINLEFNTYKYFAIPAIINIIEDVVLTIALISVPLGLYIIGRTSSSIFNILYYKVFEKKDITIINKIVISMLMTAYIFMSVELIKILDYYQIINLVIVLLSGITTTLCNVIAEKQLNKLDCMKTHYVIRSNTIFQVMRFIFFIPVCSPLVVIDINNIGYMFYIICIVASLSSQITTINKYYLLDNVKQGSLLISGLDLGRRVILFILAVGLLREIYSTYDKIGYGFVLSASCLMIYNNYKHNKIFPM